MAETRKKTGNCIIGIRIVSKQAGYIGKLIYPVFAVLSSYCCIAFSLLHWSFVGVLN